MRRSAGKDTHSVDRVGLYMRTLDVAILPRVADAGANPAAGKAGATEESGER